MKGLIIENEYNVDITVSAFLKDNPTLFESIQEELYCLHRNTEELAQYVLDNDAIIIYSTFMYKDQLHDFLDAFLQPNFPKKEIFVYNILYHLNDWLSDSFLKEPEIINKVIKLLNKGFNIYSFFEDYEGKEITDDLNGLYKKSTRHEYTYKKVYYNNCFCLERKLIKANECLQDKAKMLKYGEVTCSGGVTG